MIKADRNPKGTPRERKTWRVDKETLKRLDRYCKVRKVSQTETLEKMINCYIDRAYPIII